MRGARRWPWPLGWRTLGVDAVRPRPLAAVRVCTVCSALQALSRQRFCALLDTRSTLHLLPLGCSADVASVGCIARYLRTPNAKGAPTQHQLVPFVQLVDWAMRHTALRTVSTGLMGRAACASYRHNG